ncbi:MAG TPA: transposase [Pyrinomonadaceae bacterium]|jgi:REP element-mobilizing transposase RayT
MWNDTNVPLAYLITFRTYGSWLHGDKRGSIDRFHNQYQSPYIASNERWREYSKQLLKIEPVIFNSNQRECIAEAIQETCKLRDWLLKALNVRTNHVHLVVSIGDSKPERAISAFKANATRKMKENGYWQNKQSPWSENGSKKYLWNERNVVLAIDYVVSRQDD